MARRTTAPPGPTGGICSDGRLLRAWRWRPANGGLVSDPLRCRREAWYLVNLRLDPQSLSPSGLTLTFLDGPQPVQPRGLWLHPAGPDAGQRLAWVAAPALATHVQVRLAAPLVAVTQALHLHDVAERDPKCHPLAAVPRWRTYRPPFPLTRVVLPAALSALAPMLPWLEVELLERPASVAALAARARRAACIIDPAWIADPGLDLADLERLAAQAWVVVDLETLARLVASAGQVETRIVTHAATLGMMSARIVYADVPTRGLALQDVVPYATRDARGRFRTRVLRADRAWRRYAADTGLATLLSSETPWARHHGDVLSAARPIAGGELLATDLPWLVAGAYGPLVAPHIATHLLQMHLGGPLEDALQYWTRWDEMPVVVRDIADLARRFEPLRPVRWRAETADVAHLGLALEMPGPAPTAAVLLQTGRMDNAALHDGLPPEPLMILMKMLAREARERTPWAARHLTGTLVLWQFDTAAGLKYATGYAAAPPLPERVRRVVARLRGGAVGEVATDPAVIRLTLSDEGFCGDRSIQFQTELTARIRQAIESARG